MAGAGVAVKSACAGAPPGPQPTLPPLLDHAPIAGQYGARTVFGVRRGRPRGGVAEAMHGFIVALGRAAPHLTHQAVAEILGDVPPDGVHLFADGEGVSVAVLAPPIPGAASPFTWAPRGTLGLALGGYLLLDSSLAVAQHATRLLEAVELRGLEGALRDVVMGSFNLAVIDLARGEVMIANDRMGSIPLHYAEVPGGVIVTSVPAFLGLGRLVPREIDWTACAEILYLGHTLGERS